MSIPKPPFWLSCIDLPRALQEMCTIPLSHHHLKGLEPGDGHPVLLLPGFSADNRTTAILRYYLKRWGYQAEPWALDQNLDPQSIESFEDVIAFKDDMVNQVGQQLLDLFEQSGKRVTLIGWSLGGIFARELASHYPDQVKHLITLGTPFGNPKGIPIYALMERIKKNPMTEEQLASWLAMCNAPLGDTPLTILFSKTDGFVAKEIANNAAGEYQEAIHVCSSHAGFAINPMVLNLIANRLKEPYQAWQKFSGNNRFETMLYKHH